MKNKDRGEGVTLTLLKAQVGDFVDGGAVTVHETEELIQEQLLLRVREPTALAAGLHAAHHVLLRRHTRDPPVRPVNRNNIELEPSDESAKYGYTTWTRDAII